MSILDGLTTRDIIGLISNRIELLQDETPWAEDPNLSSAYIADFSMSTKEILLHKETMVLETIELLNLYNQRILNNLSELKSKG